MQTKSRQTLVFDPDGCTSRLRACPFMGVQGAFLRGWVVWDAAKLFEARALLLSVGLQTSFSRQGQVIWYAVRYVLDRYFPEARKQLDRVTARDC